MVALKDGKMVERLANLKDYNLVALWAQIRVVRKGEMLVEWTAD